MGTEPLLGSAGGGGCAKSGSRRSTRGILPSFGPHGCVKPYCCLSDCIEFLLGSARCYSKLEAGRGWMANGFLLPLSTCAWASFYSTRGYPQVAAQMRVKMVKDSAYSGCTVLSYLTLMAGDKGIKCPSGLPEKCRSGPLGAPPFSTMAILSASHATACPRLPSASPRASGRAPE